MEKDNKSNINSKWEQEEEVLLKDWAEKAMCYKWLHTKSNKKYSVINMKVTIPVIILSTLTGTANFAQERVPKDQQPLFAMVVGTLNIIAGIITTIAQYFKISEINEGHRIAALSWDKFSRNLRIQLTKRPKNREDCSVLMRYAKDEFDRLMEISPDIPDEIILEFKNKFCKDEDDPKKILANKFKKVDCIPRNDVIELIDMKAVQSTFNKPDICDNLAEIVVYKKTEEDKKEDNQSAKKDQFILKFKSIQGREPTEQELEDGLKVTEI
jgi:hypothetical protein